MKDRKMKGKKEITRSDLLATAAARLDDRLNKYEDGPKSMWDFDDRQVAALLRKLERDGG